MRSNDCTRNHPPQRVSARCYPLLIAHRCNERNIGGQVSGSERLSTRNYPPSCAESHPHLPLMSRGIAPQKLAESHPP